MKPFLSFVFAMLLAVAIPSFAVDMSQHEDHHPATPKGQQEQNDAMEAPKAAGASMGRMDEQMKAMRAMHEKMMAKTPEERRALMSGNMKMMKEGMAMMDNMTEGKMAGNRPMSPKMMQKKIDMMQMMMQMMMDHMEACHQMMHETAK